ncbi:MULTISPECIES: DUF4383 domain-containing protein [unclassified Streptomyces]|uniref:DUF4383 domain-containing protein n=1 Tax=unclassified Streptomyces TaxID=2593676 RepID=UPI0022597D12|nr:MULTISPECIES: DUF4383 domain-containing protein [unclassified Streptomyces]MCX4525685.1 DUF4383 domain-containing protein [Streptomyces sp. NBC_01551]MCX4543745.1 DUF4383 domain-containing protein [Streptomyces sp. NBC_01565]
MAAHASDAFRTAPRASQTHGAHGTHTTAPHAAYGCHAEHDSYAPYVPHGPIELPAPHVPYLVRRIAHPVGARLDEHLPADHKLSQVYRVGAGLMGLLLVAFGILGLIDRIGFFDTGGATVLALNTNGALSVLSICIGLLLFTGMVIGGNFASTLNIVLGLLFIASGFVNLALLDTGMNFLAFKIQNVLFSFVVGVMLMWFGMYGRVGSALPHDNPYWRARHPEQAAREQRAASGRL